MPRKSKSLRKRKSKSPRKRKSKSPRKRKSSDYWYIRRNYKPSPGYKRFLNKSETVQRMANTCKKQDKNTCVLECKWNEKSNNCELNKTKFIRDFDQGNVFMESRT